MIRTVMAPLDGSRFAEHSLPWALSVARRAQADVQVVHVHRPLEVTYAEMQVFDDALDGQLRDRERAYLEGTVAKLTAAGAKATAFNVDGEVAQTLTEHVAQRNVDLVVMTTHARGALARFWLGSVADELLHHPPAPILLIHPHEQDPVDLTADPKISNVLIPLDGTPQAEQILESALQLGKLFDASYTLLRVIPPIQPVTLPSGLGSVGDVASNLVERLDLLHDRLKKEAEVYLQGVAQRLRQQGCRVELQIVGDDQPAEGILEQARAGADLIALETHGRRGLAKLFLGSVADKVIRGAPVPVLVCRPQ